VGSRGKGVGLRKGVIELQAMLRTRTKAIKIIRLLLDRVFIITFM
jgi:hypothetical protein